MGQREAFPVCRCSRRRRKEKHLLVFFQSHDCTWHLIDPKKHLARCSCERNCFAPHYVRRNQKGILASLEKISRFPILSDSQGWFQATPFNYLVLDLCLFLPIACTASQSPKSPSSKWYESRNTLINLKDIVVTTKTVWSTPCLEKRTKPTFPHMSLQLG